MLGDDLIIQHYPFSEEHRLCHVARDTVPIDRTFHAICYVWEYSCSIRPGISFPYPGPRSFLRYCHFQNPYRHIPVPCDHYRRYHRLHRCPKNLWNWCCCYLYCLLNLSLWHFCPSYYFSLTYSLFCCFRCHPIFFFYYPLWSRH